MTPTTETLATADGHRLHAQRWRTEAPRAVLVIATGHGEHSGCYDEFARAVGSELGIDILAFDFRGHGLSDGRRGVIRHYSDLLDDLGAWLASIGDSPDLPRFVLGHSNGGLAAIRFLQTRQPEIAGLILSNPSLRLIAEAPAWKLLVGRILERFAPWVTLKTGISNDQLTQAEDEAAELDNDPLRHHRISPPTYFGMLANGPLAIEQASRITTPTYLILGGADPIADPDGGRRFFANLSATDKTLQVYETMRHEPIHELDRASVIAAMIQWLDDRLPPIAGQAARPAPSSANPRQP